MVKPKVKNRLLVVLVAILVLIVPLGLFLKASVKSKVAQEIEHFNNTHPISITYSDLGLTFVSGSSTIENISIINDSINKLNQSIHPHVSISKLKIRGLSVLSLVFDKNIDLNKFTIEDLNMVYYEKEKKVNHDNDKEVSIDSIRLKGISGLSLGNFEIENYQITLLNENNDTLTNVLGESFEIDGVKLEELSTDNYFKVDTKNFEIIASEQSVLFNKAGYNASLDKFQLNYNSGDVSIANLKLLPKDGAQALADSRTYNDDVLSIEASAINVYGLDFNDVLLEQNILADSIIIDQAKLDILKDKNKPDNLDKRPKLVHQKLKHSKSAINIGKVKVVNSSLEYVEKNPGKDNTVVPITNLNAEILNFNNIPKTGNSNALTIIANGVVLKSVPFEITLNYPDVLNSDYFNFKGSTGASKFESFNTVLLPTSGIKFEKGNLNGIQFHGRASSTHSEGELTMLYDNLDATVLKKDKLSENKTFSFLANAAIKDSNPSKNGKTTIGAIEFERTMYKGFGNYLFKTIESGLVNTVYPLGDRRKTKKKKRKG